MVVFSQSTPVEAVVAAIRGAAPAPVLALSPHELFDLEREAIARAAEGQVQFACFADFLTDAEMAGVDARAHRIEVERSGSLPRGPGEYYRLIKAEKNALILANVRRGYDVAGGELCADDLGIDAEVWRSAGFRDGTDRAPGAAGSEIGRREAGRGRLFAARAAARVGGAFASLRREHVVLETPVGNYLFFGSVRRVAPHFAGVRVLRGRPSLEAGLRAAFAAASGRLGRLAGAGPRRGLADAVLAEVVRERQVVGALSTLHEYVPATAATAERLGLPLTLLQDGYLPENYSSRYPAYFFGVRGFWVWDRLSLGLFENQGLAAAVCPFLAPPVLPMVEAAPPALRRVVVLTSGAGDWTALKNRSDEDRMVAAFVEVAAHFPGIEFVYRCHPLWTHPTHQGVDSIRRVQRHFEAKGLPNLVVSDESFARSKEFMERGELGFARSSLDHDLATADLVFGEHSFTMIEAARRGVLFASVNVTGRRDFFRSYSKLGFPHLESAAEIVGWMERLEASPGEILAAYNRAVERYNTEWAGGRVEPAAEPAMAAAAT